MEDLFKSYVLEMYSKASCSKMALKSIRDLSEIFLYMEDLSVKTDGFSEAFYAKGPIPKSPFPKFPFFFDL